MSTVIFESAFFWIFLAFYLLHEVVHFGLDFLNYRHAKKQEDYPEWYRNQITEQVFQKSKAYTLERIQFSMVTRFALLPFFWILVFRDGFNTFDLLAGRQAGMGTLSHSVLFCLYVGLYFFIAQLPIKIYSIFVIEQKYGFNNMTPSMYFVDTLKSMVLGLSLGVPVLYLIFGFMRSTGSFWWLWTWGALMLFQLAVVAVYPTFLAPIFNKFTPMDNEGLAQKIKALADRIGFQMSGVFVMDGSKRSSHSNAYFAGMGKFRRIVLFDTLIRQLSESELLAVLAHEMGHNVKKHIRNFMVVSSLLNLVGFFVLAQLLSWSDFYKAFNIMNASSHGALVIFVLASDAFTFALTPIMNALSRKNEYEADAFAAEQTGDAEAMKSALLVLAKENLSNLNPHPWYSFYHYSHPTTLERADAIDQIIVKKEAA